MGQIIFFILLSISWVIICFQDVKYYKDTKPIEIVWINFILKQIVTIILLGIALVGYLVEYVW